MSGARVSSYWFETPEQWRTCLLHRFDVGKVGGLEPMSRLGVRPRRVDAGDSGTVAAVAADPHRDVQWRAEAAFFRLAADGTLTGPAELDGALATGTRWVADREALWSFVAGGVRRYDRETLRQELAVELAGVVDIASDGRDGLWVLLRAVGDGAFALVHLDCRGQVVGRLELPCEAEHPTQLGTVDRGQQLVLLARQGRLLITLDANTGKWIRLLPVGTLLPCWSAQRLTTDARNRIALWGQRAAEDRNGPLEDQPTWALFILDGGGALLEGPFPAPAGQVTPALLAPPNDVAIGRDAVWFATAGGLWCLDGSESSMARESESTLLTAALESPEGDAARGWLRAEVLVVLPPGAVLETEFASTNDQRVARAAKAAAVDSSATTENRQEAVWEGSGLTTGRRLQVVGPTAPGVPIAIPLFETEDRWLWLRLTLVTPPGTPPPRIEALRVLYPDRSIAENLPGIFRNKEDDPDRFLRRLVGMLECTTQGLDERIRSIASHLDPDTAPATWLNYLARWLDLPWDDGLPEPVKRDLLRAAADLLELRGTRRGLERLLRCLVGRGTVQITDITVDHTPITLGGCGRAGSTLPALLAGTPARVAKLGGKSLLGRTRLACRSTDGDPLKVLAPGLRVVLGADRLTRQALQDIVPRMLDQYVPAGLQLSLSWRVLPKVLLPGAEFDGMVLDANGPGALGEDSRLGRLVLGGKNANRIDDAGLGIGFRLT